MTARSTSVVVVTLERPDHVSRCLDHLLRQTTAPTEIIVIDSSEGDETARRVQAEFPTVTYRGTSAGRGATAAARNLGFEMSSGDVIAFVDDDAFAEADWLEHLLVPYDDPDVGAVGGRQIRRQAGEITEGVDAIGRLLDDGTLTGNFAADPGRAIVVDHLLGANMSFRRTVIEEIGGIRDGYFGTCLREETDLCLRVAHLGYRLVYTPDAVVEHVAAPYPKGQRFDLRYTYWGQKNHLIMLMRNFGTVDPVVRAFLTTTGRHIGADIAKRGRQGGSKMKGGDVSGAAKSFAGLVAREAVTAAGTLTGLAAGARMARMDRRGIPVARRR